jgi:hypothetical protein
MYFTSFPSYATGLAKDRKGFRIWLLEPDAWQVDKRKEEEEDEEEEKGKKCFI